MSNKPLTLKRLVYFRNLAIVNARKKKKKDKTTVNTPVKKKRRTLRQRISAAPFNLFNRKDKAGNSYCRNIFCSKPAKDGYYCSATCRKHFLRYYEQNYIWANIRYKIFKRDKYTCKKCKKFFRISQLECDHINPVSMLKENGYKTLNLKAFDEYIYNEKNLRTLCKTCHKKVTKEYMKERRDRENGN